MADISVSKLREISGDYPGEEEVLYIVTFGAGQAHENCFIRVRATDEMEVRRFMKAHFGNKYSHIYESEDAAGVDRFNLREIK